MIAPTDGEYEVTVRNNSAFTDLAWETTTGKGQAKKGGGTNEHPLTILMTAKDEKVQITLTADGKTFGPHTVEVRAK